VSAEVLAIVVSGVGIVLTLGATMLAGVAWCVRRIDAVDQKLSARIDELDHRLTARIDIVIDDTTALKIAVARLEGPVRHLFLPGH
jgi:low affinity Fe/Cu permease